VVDRRSHVTVRATTASEIGMYLRRACTSGEVACSTRRDGRLSLEADLDAGRYFLFVDARTSPAIVYDLDVELRPLDVPVPLQ
jgi:hypothetical protein